MTGSVRVERAQQPRAKRAGHGRVVARQTFGECPGEPGKGRGLDLHRWQAAGIGGLHTAAGQTLRQAPEQVGVECAAATDQQTLCIGQVLADGTGGRVSRQLRQRGLDVDAGALNAISSMACSHAGWKRSRPVLLGGAR